MLRPSHRSRRRTACSRRLTLAAVLALCVVRTAFAQSPPSAPSQRITPPFSVDAAVFFESISSPYWLGADLVAPARAPDAIDRVLASTDGSLREVAELELQCIELRGVHEALLEAVKIDSAVSAVGFAADALRRLGQAIADRDDAPPLELLGDAYSRQNQTLTTRVLELTARHAGLSLQNRLTDEIRAYAAGLVVEATKTPNGMVSVDFVPDGERKGFVRVRNRTGAAIHGCLVVVELVPDPERAKRVQAVEDFGILPILLGGSPEDVIARKELNERNVRFLSTPQTRVVWIRDFPSAGVVEFPPCSSPSFFFLARSCEVALWPSNGAPRIVTVPGIARVQTVAAESANSATPRAGGAPPAGSDPRREIEQLKKNASTDPAAVLVRLRALREASGGDAALQAEYEALRKSIVADYQEKQRANTAAIKTASAEVQKANEAWAADRHNESLRTRHTAAKKRLEDLKDEGGRIRTILAAR